MAVQQYTPALLKIDKRFYITPQSAFATAKTSKRQQIVREIFESEHSYIAQLNTIINLFLKPVLVNGLLPSDAITAIFANIEALLSVNEALFQCMRRQSIGEAFTHMAPFLKHYSTYASNYNRTLETLQELLKQNRQFAKFVRIQESRPECHQLNLSALLITPVQRIPRYKLLLEDLLKHTRCTHMEHSKLNAALQQVTAVADHVNNFIRQQENFRKMVSIQNSFTGNYVPGIVAPGRQFIREGLLMKVCKRKPKERMVFLFSDMLLYAKTHYPSYRCRGLIPLLISEVRVKENDSRAPDATLLFEVASKDKSLVFYSSSEEMCKWAHDIEEAIRALKVAYASLLIPQLTKRRETGVCTTATRPSETTDSSLPEAGTTTPNYPLTPDSTLSNLATNQHHKANGETTTTRDGNHDEDTDSAETPQTSNGTEKSKEEGNPLEESQPLLEDEMTHSRHSITSRHSLPSGIQSKCCIIS